MITLTDNMKNIFNARLLYSKVYQPKIAPKKHVYYSIFKEDLETRV